MAAWEGEKVGAVLTVSVAGYNVEQYIRQALEPFTQQEVLGKVEVLVIDDGGQDQTLSIAKEYQEKYPGTFYAVHKENGGWGSTVNLGIRLATGTYFKQLDGDDFFAPETLAQYLQVLEHTAADLVYTPFVTFQDQDGTILDRHTWQESIAPDKEIALDQVAQTLGVQMHACTFRTELLQKAAFTISEHCFYTDIEYTLKALAGVQTIQFSDITVYCYRVAREGQSVSITGFRKHYKEHLQVLYHLLAYCAQLGLSAPVRKLYDERLLDMITTQYRIFFWLEPSAEHRSELKTFDQKIKKEYPQFYGGVGLKKVRLLRRTNFAGYAAVVRHELKKMKYDR